MEVIVDFRLKNFYFLQNKLLQNTSGYTCIVKQIVFHEQNSERITIVGEHQENKTNRDVVGISIRNQTQIQKFPRGFGKIFESVKYFEIDNSSITMLRKEDFLDLGHLQGLWLPRNHIVALPGDLFTNVQGLRFLSFDKNMLKYVGHDILKPLKNLERANFCENTTIDKAYNGGEEELAALNREIAMKCIAPPSVKDSPTESQKVIELEGRVKLLETKVKKLENEKAMQEAKLLQVAGITQMIEIMQARLDVLETVLT